MPRNATAQNIVIHEPAAKPIGPSYQLSPNKFFDSIIPSKRTSRIQNGRQGTPQNGAVKLVLFQFLPYKTYKGAH